MGVRPGEIAMPAEGPGQDPPLDRAPQATGHPPGRPPGPRRDGGPAGGPTGRVVHVLLDPHDEPRPELVEEGRPWSFDGDGELFRLVAEPHRIRLAYLFDPLLAVRTSLPEPLPNQVTLPRQPLRFLGAGKTITAALLTAVPGGLSREPGRAPPALPDPLRGHQRQAGGRAY